MTTPTRLILTTLLVFAVPSPARPLAPSPALPQEVTLPATADAALEEAVGRYVRADAALSEVTRALDATKRALVFGRVERRPAHQLRVMVLNWDAARGDVEEAQREVAAAERGMRQAAARREEP
jgi:hypothetical protein